MLGGALASSGYGTAFGQKVFRFHATRHWNVCENKGVSLEARDSRSTQWHSQVWQRASKREPDWRTDRQSFTWFVCLFILSFLSCLLTQCECSQWLATQPDAHYVTHTHFRTCFWQANPSPSRPSLSSDKLLSNFLLRTAEPWKSRHGRPFYRPLPCLVNATGVLYFTGWNACNTTHS